MSRAAGFVLLFLLVFTGLFASFPGHANPWLPGAGRHDVFISVPHSTASRAFDENEEPALKTSFSNTGLDIYVASGLTPHLALITALLAARERETPEGGAQEEVYKLDASLTLRTSLWRGSSWALATDIQLGYKGRDYRSLGTSSDEFKISPAFHLGRSGTFLNANAYSQFSIAFNHYPQHDSLDSAEWHASSGFYPHRDILVFTGMTQEIPAEGARAEKRISLTLLVGVHCQLSPGVLLTTTGSYILSGRNETQDTEFALGLGFRF